MISSVAIESYRSLRSLVMPLGGINVVTGANGSGKSSLYRALRLLADTARNGAVAALAREGGLESTLWAGPEAGSIGAKRRGYPTQGTRRNAPVCVKLGFADDERGYAIDLGLPTPPPSGAFRLDPEIKAEAIWYGPQLRPSTLLTDRKGPMVRIREDDGSWKTIDHRLQPYDSMLAELGMPEQAPEVMAVRAELRSWRFYDHFCTDPLAPARASHIGTRTPVLSADGADLAAALQTIVESGGGDKLAEVIDHAFPGSAVRVENRFGRFELDFQQPGLLRPLASAELSDGTLRYLLLVAALLTPRPPALFVFNEPETSLHPELLGPLAALIQIAATDTQTIVVTHSAALVEGLDAGSSGNEVQIFELCKELGETRIVGQRPIDQPAWTWPTR